LRLKNDEYISEIKFGFHYSLIKIRC